MLIRNFFAYFLAFSFLLTPTFVLDSNAAKDEIQMLKEQMKQMEKNMEMMNKKIVELEEKNRKLEQEASKDKKERGVVEKTIAKRLIQPSGQIFLGQAFQTLNPEISVIGLFAGAWYSEYSEDEPNPLAEADPQETGINLQELEIGFQSVVDPYFRFDSFLSLSGEGVELEEAYGTTLLSLPANSQFRVGVMRSKFGRINQLHRHNQNFVTLPITVNEFLGEHFNPASVEANFLLPLPWYMEFSASIGSPDVETASFGWHENEDNNNLGKLLYTFHLANFFELSESLGVSLGGSLATGPNDTASGNRTNLYGVDFFAKYRPIKSSPYQELQLQSEFMYRDAETEDGDLDDWGFYSQAVYRFAKRWNVGVRYGINDTNDPISHEDLEDDEHEEDGAGHEEDGAGHEGDGAGHGGEDGGHRHAENPLGLSGEQYRISAMLTFNPTEFSRIRLEYNYIDQDFAEDQHGIFLQFQYAIGAHGAHPY